jgi:hypothetical protein
MRSLLIAALFTAAFSLSSVADAHPRPDRGCHGRAATQLFLAQGISGVRVTGTPCRRAVRALRRWAAAGATGSGPPGWRCRADRLNPDTERTSCRRRAKRLRFDINRRSAATAAAEAPMLLVHGYGPVAQGKDCNGSTWRNALRFFGTAGGRPRASIVTVGYYAGTRGCDVMIGDGKANNDRPIQDIARDLAQHIDRSYTSKGLPVDIVAHSMGGLITRVALLGSAQGWDGFPGKLRVDDVVTLGTPHQGVTDPAASRTRQWRQMAPGSSFLRRLHAPGSSLADDWAAGTDWSLVGSEEDAVVSGDSAIDRGGHADQKYVYEDDAGDAGPVDHERLRTAFGRNRYRLTYWHAAGDHPAHRTTSGWSPLKTAFRAGTRDGDGLPR